MNIRPAFLMTKDELATWLSMPKFGGHIVDPRYIQNGPARDAYLEQLRAWAKRHSRRDWPQWLIEFAEITRAQQAGADRRDEPGTVPALAQG